MFVSNVGLSARLAIGCGGRALVCVGCVGCRLGCVGCRLGCGDLPCRGLSRPHHEAGVELVFVEEQQARARAVLVYLDVPGPHGGPCAARLNDVVARRARHAQCQFVCALLGQVSYLPPFPTRSGRVTIYQEDLKPSNPSQLSSKILNIS